MICRAYFAMICGCVQRQSITKSSANRVIAIALFASIVFTWTISPPKEGVENAPMYRVDPPVVLERTGTIYEIAWPPFML